MSIFADIHNALNTQLSGISGIPDVFWPNMQNDAPTSGNWIRPTLLPGSSSLYTLNNENMHHGIYQVDIFMSMKKGISDINAVADAIRDGFNRQSLNAGGIIIHIQEISISPMNRDETWWHCFVEVNYISIS